MWDLQNFTLTTRDRWNSASSPSQHLKIYDLSDPANPKYIMDFGYPGQNPGSTFIMPGTTNVVPPGVHGPIVATTLNGQPVNRLYMPYGVGYVGNSAAGRRCRATKRVLHAGDGSRRAARLSQVEQIRKNTVWWEAAPQPGAFLARGRCHEPSRLP